MSNDTISPYTSWFFARSGFWTGVASILDFGGTLNEYNTALTPEQADRLAMESDCRAVVSDVWVAFAEIKRDHIASTSGT